MRIQSGKNSRFLMLFLAVIFFLFTKQIVLGADNSVFDKINEYLEKARILSQKEVMVKNTAPKSIKGIYMTAATFNSKYGKGLIETLLNKGGNAITLDIQHGGGLLAFTPQNEYLKTINKGSTTLDDLPQRIKEMHEKGLYVVARQVVFNGPYIGARKPEWGIKNRGGGYYKYEWLDPSRPEVQEYNLTLLRELAQMGFDEIQFDYIRFPAANQRYLDYYYDENQLTRMDVINDFLKKAKKITDEKGVYLGVDVFGAIVWGDIDWKIVGQDPIEMAKIVDAIYPMTYPSHFGPGYNGHPDPHNKPYSIVYDSIERFVAASGGNAEIRPWVQGFPLKVRNFGSWFMEEQINAAFDAGSDDFMIWSPGNKYTYSWPTFLLVPKSKETVAVPQL